MVRDTVPRWTGGGWRIGSNAGETFGRFGSKRSFGRGGVHARARGHMSPASSLVESCCGLALA
eukprot:COSAG03_NODE_952_length_5213_cov_163.854713_2_plen_63_part_00